MTTPELLSRLRKELEAERESTLAQLEELGAEPRGEKVDRIDVDEGFADSAAATAERSELLALISTARERLGEIERALARMDDGTYGVCEVCGQPIPEARLEARPLSVRCVTCAAAS
ncbi:MAG TPA: TraR/DksA C4-type zinc finger protein [Egibacteraceae bacterium]